MVFQRVSIAPGATADVTITFSPFASMQSSDTLNLAWSCSTANAAAVPVSGNGVYAPVPPIQKIADLLAFIDAAVADGSLAGDGPAKSANGWLGALQNMIEAAGSLIKSGQITEACNQFCDVLSRTDGAPRPPDFVSGLAADELADRIRMLMTMLGCQ